MYVHVFVCVCVSECVWVCVHVHIHSVSPTLTWFHRSIHSYCTSLFSSIFLTTQYSLLATEGGSAYIPVDLQGVGTGNPAGQ